MAKNKPRLVGATKDGRAEIYHAGANTLLKWLHRRERKFRLIFCDPPFNIGRDYGSGIRDNLAHETYAAWTRRWLDLAIKVLDDDGALWVNVFDNIAAEIVCHMKQRGYHMPRWVIWHYRFGQCQSANFIQSHQHGLLFCRDPEHKCIDVSGVLEPSDRATKYADHRTTGKKKGVDGMRPPLDVWQGDGFSRITGNNRERWRSPERPNGHDNQLPVRYLKRVILALTREGDSVLDPCVGSGTTALAARALGRNVVGGDLSLESAVSAFRRVRSSAQNAIVRESAA
jgi:site-specific DNA-methyltransferase (adenine-specific)